VDGGEMKTSKFCLVTILVVMLALVSAPAAFAARPDGSSHCPEGNVKSEGGSGYAYSDGSGWIIFDKDSAEWGANERHTIVAVCIKTGGKRGGILYNPNPETGSWNNPEKWAVSHVVIYTEERPPEPECTCTELNPVLTVVSVVEISDAQTAVTIRGNWGDCGSDRADFLFGDHYGDTSFGIRQLARGEEFTWTFDRSWTEDYEVRVELLLEEGCSDVVWITIPIRDYAPETTTETVDSCTPPPGWGNTVRLYYARLPEKVWDFEVLVESDVTITVFHYQDFANVGCPFTKDEDLQDNETYLIDFPEPWEDHEVGDGKKEPHYGKVVRRTRMEPGKYQVVTKVTSHGSVNVGVEIDIKPDAKEQCSNLALNVRADNSDSRYSYVWAKASWSGPPEEILIDFDGRDERGYRKGDPEIPRDGWQFDRLILKENYNFVVKAYAPGFPECKDEVVVVIPPYDEPEETPTPTEPTATPTKPTPTGTLEPTPTETDVPTSTPTGTLTPTDTQEPTPSDTPIPTDKPTRESECLYMRKTDDGYHAVVKSFPGGKSFEVWHLVADQKTLVIKGVTGSGSNQKSPDFYIGNYIADGRGILKAYTGNARSTSEDCEISLGGWATTGLGPNVVLIVAVVVSLLLLGGFLARRVMVARRNH